MSYFARATQKSLNQKILEQALSTIFHYINLKNAERRNEFMIFQADIAGIRDQIVRFSAKDANNPETIEKAGYSPAQWGARWSLTRTEIAVFESHRALWKKVAEGSNTAAVIMEDDIFLSPKIRSETMNLVGSGLKFDVIRLDGCKREQRYGPKKNDHPNLREILQTVPSAACYLVSKAGAEKLLARSQSYCDHVDDFLFAPRNGWLTFQLWPAVAVQGMFCKSETFHQFSGEISTSVRTSVQSELETPDKGPIAYRIGKEAKRFVAKCRRKFGSDRQLIHRGGVVGFPPLAEGLPEYR